MLDLDILYWIFYTIVVHDPRVRHDLERRSYLQGQSEHIVKIRVRAITLYCHIGSGQYFTQLLSMTQECVMTLGRGHTSYVKLNT